MREMVPTAAFAAIGLKRSDAILEVTSSPGAFHSQPVKQPIAPSLPIGLHTAGLRLQRTTALHLPIAISTDRNEPQRFAAHFTSGLF